MIRCSALCLPILGLSLAITLTSARAAAPKDPLASERAAICVMYDQMNSAFAANRIDQAMQIIASDYTERDPGGKTLDKRGIMHKLQDERRQITSVATQYTITSVAPDPRGILVEMRMHSAGTGQKRILFVKVNGRFTNDMIVQDLWVPSGDGWRLQARKTILDQSHMSPA